MLNPHRRRPPTSALATNNARPLRRRIKFRSGAPIIINISEPRGLTPSLALPLRSSLRVPPVRRNIDVELELGAARSERRPFGFTSPANREYQRGDRVLSARGRPALARARAVRRAPPRRRTEYAIVEYYVGKLFLAPQVKRARVVRDFRDDAGRWL